jgi:hypothetical protein
MRTNIMLRIWAHLSTRPRALKCAVIVCGILFGCLIGWIQGFWIMPCCGIYKRNSAGTYDRYVIWPLGRCVDDPTLCKTEPR